MAVLKLNLNLRHSQNVVVLFPYPYLIRENECGYNMATASTGNLCTSNPLTPVGGCIPLNEEFCGFTIYTLDVDR